VLLALALYQTVVEAEPFVEVVLIVYGEPLAGMPAYVTALGAALFKVAPLPVKPARLSMCQPQVPLMSVIGDAAVPVEAVMLLLPLTIEVVVALFSCMVTVKPAVSLVLALTVSLAVDCLPVESGVMAPSVTVGPLDHEMSTGFTVKFTVVVDVWVSAEATNGKLTAAKLIPATRRTQMYLRLSLSI